MRLCSDQLVGLLLVAAPSHARCMLAVHAVLRTLHPFICRHGLLVCLLSLYLAWACQQQALHATYRACCILVASSLVTLPSFLSARVHTQVACLKSRCAYWYGTRALKKIPAADARVGAPLPTAADAGCAVGLVGCESVKGTCDHPASASTAHGMACMNGCSVCCELREVWAPMVCPLPA